VNGISDLASDLPAIFAVDEFAAAAFGRSREELSGVPVEAVPGDSNTNQSLVACRETSAVVAQEDAARLGL